MKLPNWITDNDWSLKSRMDWAKQIMAFSARDWSIYSYAESGAPDMESWKLYCLITCDTKEEAIATWSTCSDTYWQDDAVSRGLRTLMWEEGCK